MPTYSAPLPHDSGYRQRPDLSSSAGLKSPRTRFERRPCRADIVDQDRNQAAEFKGRPGRREGVPDVAMSSSCRQGRLRLGCSDTAKPVDRAECEMGCEVGRLIESSLALPSGMKRHRYDHVRPIEYPRATIAHQPGQRTCQRSASLVFHGVDDFSKRAFICAYRTGRGNPAADATAPGALFQGHAEDSPGRKRIAASEAQRRRQGED